MTNDLEVPGLLSRWWLLSVLCCSPLASLSFSGSLSKLSTLLLLIGLSMCNIRDFNAPDPAADPNPGSLYLVGDELITPAISNELGRFFNCGTLGGCSNGFDHVSLLGDPVSVVSLNIEFKLYEALLGDIFR